MKIGYLPLYIKLYDDGDVDRTVLKKFYEDTTKLFEERGIEVVTSDFCRIESEFKAVVKMFEEAEVDAIVTWHAAYSPSLESVDVLANTKLPIIVFDSTPTANFSIKNGTEEIDWNHGIHGVMDMCSMLKRYGKPYAIAAGHYLESDVIDRVCGFVRSAIAAKKLDGMKVGLVGGAFKGMGDFSVEPAELKKRFGITVETIEPARLAELSKTVTCDEVQAEIMADRQRFEFDNNVIEEEYENYTRASLSVRKYIENDGLGAFSVNFLNVDAEDLGTMPFTEACKAMERGVGYAGEGDALTASFTGALLAGYPETTFVEIFCPVWNKNKVLLSHMGEVNYRIADGKPLLRRTGSPFVKKIMPYAGYAKMKPGKGVYVNISRDKDDYQLLLTPCEMLPSKNDIPHVVRGWMQPETTNTTAEFLEKLSKNGATHHSTFVYGATVEELEYFAKLLSLKTVII